MLMNCSIGMCSLAITFDSESSDANIEHIHVVTLSLPHVWITGLKINTIYSKRDSSLTMDVAVILLKVYNWFGLNTDIYMLYKGSRKIGFFSPKK